MALRGVGKGWGGAFTAWWPEEGTMWCLLLNVRGSNTICDVKKTSVPSSASVETRD